LYRTLLNFGFAIIKTLFYLKEQKNIMMETITTTEKNSAAIIHLSTLTQYCIPFGNYIFPILIWVSKKEKSKFNDFNGKQVLNFQLTLLLYSIILILVALPIFVLTIFNNLSLTTVIDNHDFTINQLNLENNTILIMIGILAVVFFIILKIAEIFLTIYATIKSSNGEYYKYPLTIHFIK
jgi:hypothetical protein